jgi:hypothetical protein
MRRPSPSEILNLIPGSILFVLLRPNVFPAEWNYYSVFGRIGAVGGAGASSGVYLNPRNQTS